MNCRSCGASLSPAQRFCPQCGMAVDARPSREAVRAHVQGGGRHAAPARGAALAPESMLRLLSLGAGLLWILQLVYLFMQSLFINMNYGDFNLGNVAFSVYGALKEGSGAFLGVLLVLLCLAGLGSLVLPRRLTGRRMPLLMGILAALTLILFVLALTRINSAFDKAYFGIKPTMGLFVWLFLLNCLLLGALAYWIGREEELLPPEPARVRKPARASAQARPAASRTAPVNSGAAPRRTAPPRNVTPPDAETIAALRRMAEMHRQGLVSDAEFARIKAECVARGWIRE